MTSSPSTPALTPERKAEIKARLDAATPGPWHTHVEPAEGWDWLVAMCYTNEAPLRYFVSAQRATDDTPLSTGDADAEFISHAPSDIADLLNEVERLQVIATEAKADRDSMWKFAFRCARHLNASQLTEASQGTDVTVNICGENGPEMILASRTDRGINAR